MAVFNAELQIHHHVTTVPSITTASGGISLGDQEGGREGEGEREEEEDQQEPRHLLRPCIHCLQLLAYSSDNLRQKLGCDVKFLLDIFRG